MKKLLSRAFLALLAFFGVTYFVFKADLDGKALRFIEPYFHKLLGHSKKW